MSLKKRKKNISYNVSVINNKDLVVYKKMYRKLNPRLQSNQLQCKYKLKAYSII